MGDDSPAVRHGLVRHGLVRHGHRCGSLLAAESRGTLRGRFVYDGEPPERKKVLVTKDKEICGALGLQTEQLVVSEDGGIADVILWARTKNLPEPEGPPEGGHGGTG